jgi:hypothetical protein
MFELLLVYCLAAEPDRCVEREMPLENAVSSFECAMNGQLEASRYLALHPEWLLRRFSCRPEARHEDAI